MTRGKSNGTVTLSAVLCLVLGLCCAGGGGVITGLPILLREFTAKAARQMHRAIPEQRKRLQARRESARSAQERREIDNQLEALRRMESTNLSALGEAILPESVLNCAVFEGLMALTLNVLLFIAGCGMFGCNPWARKLGLWAATARILTVGLFLVLLYAVAVPAMEQGLQQAQVMIGQSGSEKGIGEFLATLKSRALLWGILSAAVPAALLVLLNTPAAREAFRKDYGGGSGFEVTGGGGPSITVVPR
jgi:hypothetical protein